MQNSRYQLLNLSIFMKITPVIAFFQTVIFMLLSASSKPFFIKKTNPYFL